MTNTKMKSSM